MIAVELEVLAKKFDRFGWDRDRGSAAHDRLILDWMDALQDYPLDEVRAACRAAVIENPGKMPNEGHIVAAIMAGRKAHVAVLPKPERPPADVIKEPLEHRRKVAAEVMARAGFKMKSIEAAE